MPYRLNNAEKRAQWATANQILAAMREDEAREIMIPVAAEIAKEPVETPEERYQPAPGTWAETARMMARMFPGEDWDAWKDQMKEAAYND